MPELDEFRRWFRDRNYSAIKRGLRNQIESNNYVYTHHPLGFLLAEVCQTASATLRLHYWKQDLASLGSAITPYHDHIWRLSSCVLHGEIENCVLDVELRADGEYFLTEVQQREGVDSVPSEGDRASFEISTSERIQEGGFYFLAPRVFHFSKLIPGKDALTLVLSEPEILGNPRTLMPIASRGHAPKRKKMSNNEEISREIVSLLEK
ncbi:hypothetical protein [Hoeflea poritis]|uniref:DUF386 domain-containing protein n=1 Tax=Hoeflea poritis TaxID=2993659 RepID=A0ABT4VM73_9HYPH|nr:hypothetical protein [Hoeflea poritis]MDA4845250.1 hypothetical protein [Hoeflea poritis]